MRILQLKIACFQFRLALLFGALSLWCFQAACQRVAGSLSENARKTGAARIDHGGEGV